MQLTFREHFQLIAFQKLWDWRLEKFCMKNRTYLLDLHQRSHYDKITIGPEGMMNRVLQMNNSQSVNSINSLLEKHLVSSFPNQPNPNPIQSVIDQGNLRTQNLVLWIKEKSPVHKRSMKSVCTKNLVLQTDQGNLIICLKTPVLSKHTMEQDNLWPSSSSTHSVKEQFAPEENRDIASFNADNEFNRAIDEENIDFNIPGVPNSTVKRSHGVNVQNLIQKIENHPQRQALQSDLQQHRQFNPFSKESQDVIKAAGNTELCELLDVEPKTQCKTCLTCWDAGIVQCTCGYFLRDDTTENKKCIKTILDLFSIPNFFIRKSRPHGHRYGKKEGYQENHTANLLQKKCKKREFLSIHDPFIRDARFRKTMVELGRTEEVIREMDKFANEDHTHIATEKNSTYTAAIGGYVRILLVPTPWKASSWF